MNVALLYFEGCPSWRVADQRLREALTRVGRSDATVHHHKVSTPEEAQAARFHGSPTLLVDGRDPFDPGNAPVGLFCRLYRTPQGLAGSPTVEQLAEVLR